MDYKNITLSELIMHLRNQGVPKTRAEYLAKKLKGVH